MREACPKQKASAKNVELNMVMIYFEKTYIGKLNPFTLQFPISHSIFFLKGKHMNYKSFAQNYKFI